MGMRRIHIYIDSLVFRGIESGDHKGITAGLQRELSQVLGNSAGYRSHRTPVMKLGRMPLEPGASGGHKFGGTMARAIGKGLKP